MMNSWMSGVAMSLLMALGVASVSPAQDSLTVAVRDSELSVAAVYAYDRQDKILGQGNGFFITQEGHLITCRDFLEGADHASVRTKDGMLYPVINVLGEDRETNLLQISVDISPHDVHPALLNSVPPQPGEQVFTVSSPWGTNKPVISGTVSAILEVPAFGKMIQLFIRLPRSFNGSPVLDQKGQVIGIASLVDTQDFAIFPAERILKMALGRGQSFSRWDTTKVKVSERRYQAGLVYLGKTDYVKALSFFREAVARDPQFTLAYFQIGYCYAQLRRYQDAVEAYREALQIKPDFVLAHFFLGLAYLELKDKAGAQREYETLRDQDSEYAQYLLDLI
jgi:hypothetical protein